MAVDKSVIDQQIADLADFDRYFTRKERDHLHEVMSPGETIRAMTSGFCDGNTWLITITDERVIFLDKGLLGGLKQLEILIPKISSVYYKTGIVMGEIQITTSGESKKITSIEKSDIPKISDVISKIMRGLTDSEKSQEANVQTSLKETVYEKNNDGSSNDTIDMTNGTPNLKQETGANHQVDGGPLGEDVALNPRSNAGSGFENVLIFILVITCIVVLYNVWDTYQHLEKPPSYDSPTQASAARQKEAVQTPTGEPKVNSIEEVNCLTRLVLERAEGKNRMSDEEIARLCDSLF